MSAVRLYGPDGRAMLTTGEVSKDVVEGEVLKRVRSQATTLTSVWDPRRGKPKPTPITFDTLRMMSHRNEWVSAIVKTRKNQLGRMKWSIVPRDEDDDSPSTMKLCESQTELLKRPSMRGSRPHSRSWRQFINEVLDDILVLDAGCIEKERDGRGWIIAMYPVDGATIRPNIDDRGGYADDAYVQLVDGQVTARFGMEDLIYIMDNPQTDVRWSGYGFSPLEHLTVSVTAELFASKYNSDYFQKGSVPEGMVNLGEDVAPEDVDGFRLYWMNEVMGKPWAIPIVGGKGVEWIPWRASNKDMEWQAYQQWLLKKICAVFQIPPQEVGELEDVNRSTAQDQTEINRSKSLEPLLTLIEDFFETEVIGVHGQGLGDYIRFKWDVEAENEEQINQKFSILVQAGAASRNEWREALTMDPVDDEGADLLLVSGSLQGLPTEEDIKVQGAAAQQQRQEEQQQQQMQMQGGTPGTMPWKPGQPNTPGLAQAQREHREQASQGTGVIENQTPQIGKSSEEEYETAGEDVAKGRTHIGTWHHYVDASGGKFRVQANSTRSAHRIAAVKLKLPLQYRGYRFSKALGGTLSHEDKPVKVDINHPDLHDVRPTVEREQAKMSAKPAAPKIAVPKPAKPALVAKDRHPALTAHEHDFEEVWEDANERLYEGIREILALP